jgi:hypothetical protein
VYRTDPSIEVLQMNLSIYYCVPSFFASQWKFHINKEKIREHKNKRSYSAW